VSAPVEAALDLGVQIDAPALPVAAISTDPGVTVQPSIRADMRALLDHA
jgi:hypothetical protein